MTEVVKVPLTDIWADESFNSRGWFPTGSVASLADSIQQRGLLQPITIQKHDNPERRTKYKIVMGHRRFAAHELLKLPVIDAIVVEPLPEADARVMNVLENLDREPLNMVQEAHSVKWFKEQGWDPRTVAKRINKPVKWVQSRYGLLSLPEEIQRRAEADYLTQYQLETILDMPTTDEKFAYVREIVDRKEGKIKPKKEIDPATKLARKKIDVYAQGVARSPAEIGLVQESIQDSFGDNANPMAVVLGWAAGFITYERMLEVLRAEATTQGVTYREHAELVKRAS